MTRVLEELESRGGLGLPVIQRYLREETFPLVDGTSVTFVYFGHADEVKLRHWIHGLPPAIPFERVPETDLWTVTVEIPEESRIEYKLEVVQGDQHRLVRDEYNPHLAYDPYGANSVVLGAGYVYPEWAEENPESRAGRIEELRLRSDVLGSLRPIKLYLPALFRQERRYPLLIVHDGDDYVRFSHLKQILDNLIHRLEIPPMLVALTQSPDRMNEYAASEKHARFLAEELVPLLESRYPLVSTPAARGLMGASFGAVASLATAWYHPDTFGQLLLQSGSFAFTDIGEFEGGPVFEPVVDFVNDFRKAPGKPAERLFVSCGSYEPMIYYNRSMIPLLQATGMEVRYVESRDGHNWDSWRDRLREGLSWLFPGPLWMVYE